MTAQLPALHVGETVAEVTVLDGRVLVAAIALLVAALVVIWSPARLRAVRLGHAVRLRAAGHAALALVVFFAVLPSAVPYDHLLFDSTSEDQAAHAQHCHGSQSECAGGSAGSAIPPQLLPSQTLLAAPALVSVLLFFLIVPLHGMTRPPELRPPLLAIA